MQHALSPLPQKAVIVDKNSSFSTDLHVPLTVSSAPTGFKELLSGFASSEQVSLSLLAVVSRAGVPIEASASCVLIPDSRSCC
jgi:hypothetical protein